MKTDISGSRGRTHEKTDTIDSYSRCDSCCSNLWRNQKESYTNIVAGDYFSTVQVAELPGEMAAGTCEELENQLPEVPVILRVTAIDEIEHFLEGAVRKYLSMKYIGEKK